jgi:hypothetical protein
MQPLDWTFPTSLCHERLFDGLARGTRGKDLGGAAPESSQEKLVSQWSADCLEVFCDPTTVHEERLVDYFVRHLHVREVQEQHWQFPSRALSGLAPSLHGGVFELCACLCL